LRRGRGRRVVVRYPSAGVFYFRSLRSRLHALGLSAVAVCFFALRSRECSWRCLSSPAHLLTLVCSVFFMLLSTASFSSQRG
jgi:hypothetical protein